MRATHLPTPLPTNEPTTEPTSPRRHRGRVAALVGTAAALAISLLPTSSAVAMTSEEDDGDATASTVETTQPAAVPAESLVRVRLRVADRAVERVTARRGIWPVVMLREQGVRTHRNDLVVVKRDGRRLHGQKRRLREGTLVKVVDVRHRTRLKKVRVGQRTVVRRTTDLKPGRRKVVATGRPAVHELKVRRTLHNDRLVERKVVSRKVVRPAKPRRVLVGRKATSVPGADGLNWAALARCESGGNPRAVNPAGYYGLYQFNVATWRSVGGSGMPHHATAQQQTYRAKLLYKSRGRQPWPHCGRYL